MLGDKFRFRFVKAGTLRLLSHHDLMRCLERMLRRADVPFKSTAGFHPGPRIVFALSLPLGVVGRDEVLELELTRPCNAADVLVSLNTQAPQGLSFTRVSVVPMKATAIPRRVVYTLPLPQDRVAGTELRIGKLLAEEKVWVDRIKPSRKRLNIRPYFRDMAVAPSPGERAETPSRPSPVDQPSHHLVLDLWVTQTGTARADELVRLLDLSDLVGAGAVLERVTVEVRDEVTDSESGQGPPDEPAETMPLEPTAYAAGPQGDESQPAEAHWGASPAGPVVE